MDYQGGTVVSRKRGRTVTRLEMGGRAFYLKRNKLDWREWLKQLSQLRIPGRNAIHEWSAILTVRSLKIPTVSPVATGEKLFLGRELASFILIEELYGARSLEEVIASEYKGVNSGLSLHRKRRLIHEVANIAKKLHRANVYHQDFYLGHFFLGGDETLYLIDLQRIISKKKPSRRYMIKDLAQLNYSAALTGTVSKADCMRFFLDYCGKRRLGPEERALIAEIMAKTSRIAAHTVKLLERRRRRKEIP